MALVIVKLDDRKKPANGGIVVAIADSMNSAFKARYVTNCGRSVIDPSRVIWRGFEGCRVGDRVRL